jgi:hypothetical protein
MKHAANDAIGAARAPISLMQMQLVQIRQQ